MIPFVNLNEQRKAYQNELKNTIENVLESGCFIGGDHVFSLENELSEYLKKKSNSSSDIYTTLCGSGTDALTIALMALAIAPGDEVIVPDFTFIAPAEAVSLLGATPIFADIDAQTLQIQPQSVESKITEKTKGIIAVNLFGQCAPYTELQRIAEKHNLWIIEDAAQSFGATQINSKGNLQASCTFGNISTTSFYPTKPLGCYGDGGALFTQDTKLAERIKMIANHGSQSHYQHKLIGVNSRLDAIQAAILQVKLRHLDCELAKRTENAKKYDEYFSGQNGIRIQRTAIGNTSTYAQYTLLVDDRDSFTNKLNSLKIPYCIHYPAPLHNQECFCKTPCRGFNPNATLASKQAVSLPICAFTHVETILQLMGR